MRQGGCLPRDLRAWPNACMLRAACVLHVSCICSSPVQFYVSWPAKACKITLPEEMGKRHIHRMVEGKKKKGGKDACCWPLNGMEGLDAFPFLFLFASSHGISREGSFSGRCSLPPAPSPKALSSHLPTPPAMDGLGMPGQNVIEKGG